MHSTCTYQHGLNRATTVTFLAWVEARIEMRFCACVWLLIERTDDRGHGTNSVACVAFLWVYVFCDTCKLDGTASIDPRVCPARYLVSLVAISHTRVVHALCASSMARVSNVPRGRPELRQSFADSCKACIISQTLAYRRALTIHCPTAC